MPQPLESGIDGHQRGDNLHAVVSASTTGVNLAGNLVKVVPHAGKLTKQRRCSSSVTHMVSILLRLSANPAS